MAFQFLTQLLPAANLLAGLYGQKQANKAVSKNNVPTAAERQSNALYQALADPNSPLFQQFEEKSKADNVAAFLAQLRGMQQADRRENALGRRGTFFNPERADESMSFLTSRGLPQMNALASQQARNRILEAARGIQTNQAPQAGRQGINMQQGISNAAYQTQLPAQLINILQGLGGGNSMTDPRWQGNIFYG